MNLKSQKRLAASIMKVGKTRVKINPKRIEDVNEALTKDDVRALISDNAITKKPKQGISRGRVRLKNAQKKKGRRRGKGKREGTLKARTPKKRAWINKIRAIRDELKKMRAEASLTATEYRDLYLKAKGNLFQSRRHIHEYIERVKR